MSWTRTRPGTPAVCCGVSRKGTTCYVAPDGTAARCVSAGQGEVPPGWELQHSKSNATRKGLGVLIRRVSDQPLDLGTVARLQTAARKQSEYAVPLEDARLLMPHVLAWLDRYVRSTEYGVQLDAAYCEQKRVPHEPHAQFPWVGTASERSALVEHVADVTGLLSTRIAKALPEPGPYVVEPVRGADGRARNGRWTWVGEQQFEATGKAKRTMRRLSGAPLVPHWPRGSWSKAKDTSVLAVVEGERKAEDLVRRTGVAAVSVNGIYNFAPSSPAVRQLTRDIGFGASKVKRVHLVPDRETCHGEGKDNERRAIEKWGAAASKLFPGAEIVAVTWDEKLGPDPDDALRALDYEGDGLPHEFEVLPWEEYVARWPWEQREDQSAESRTEEPDARVLVPEGSRPCTVNEAREGIVDEVLDEAVTWSKGERNRIAVVVVPVGVGKSGVAARFMARDPKSAYAAPSHKLAKEFTARLRGEGANPEHLYGIEKGCVDDQIRKNVIGVHGVIPKFRARFCGECKLKGECPSYPSERHLYRPVVLSHDGVDSMGDSQIEGLLDSTTLLKDRTLFYDEAVASLKMTELSVEELNHVREHPHLYEPFEFTDDPQRQAHRAAVLAVTNHMESLADEANARHKRRLEAAETDSERQRIAAYPEAMRITDEDLVSIDEHLRRLNEFSGDALSPGPSTEALREGLITPDRLRIEGIVQLWHSLAGIAGVRDESTPDHVLVQLGKDGTTIETRRVHPVRSGSVILDATGNLTLDELRAANPGKDVRAFVLDVQPERDAAPVHRLHLLSGRGTHARRTLCPSGMIKPRTSGTIRNALRRAAGYAREKGLDPAALRVGILTYSPIAKALREPEFRAAAEDGGLRIDPKCIGYFGLDDRGSNAFEECDILIVFGTPTPNLGAAWSDADALGLDSDRVAHARTQATLVQALGRLRAIDPRPTERLLVAVGNVAPVGWEDAEVRRFQVTVEDRVEQDATATEALAEVLLREGVVPLAMAGGRVADNCYRSPNSSCLPLSTSGWAGRERTAARTRLEAVAERLAEQGIETVDELVKVPGIQARGVRALRLASLTREEAGERLAEMVAVANTESSTGAETQLSTPELPAEVEVPVAAAKSASREPLQSSQAVPHDAVVVPPTESFQEVPEFALDDPYGKPDEPVARTAPEHVMEEVRAPVRAVLVPPAAREAMAAAIRVAAYVEGVPEEVATRAAQLVPEFVRLAGAPPWQEALARAVHGERELCGPWLERAAREALADAAAVADAEARLAAGYDTRVTVPAGQAMVALEYVHVHQPTLDDLGVAAQAETHEIAVCRVALEQTRRFRQIMEESLQEATKARGLPRWSAEQEAAAVAGLGEWYSDAAMRLERRGRADEANLLSELSRHMAGEHWPIAEVPRRAFDYVLEQAIEHAALISSELLEELNGLAVSVEVSALPLSSCEPLDGVPLERVREFNRGGTVSSFAGRVVRKLTQRALDAVEGLRAEG